MYRFDKEEIKKQGLLTIEKIYADTSWMEGYNLGFYKNISNHRRHRESALRKFYEDFNPHYYHYNLLPTLDYEENSFDLLLSSHLLFVYDDRFDYAFHKASILEMLRVAKEVRIFSLVDYKNSRVAKENNFSPFVYRIIKELTEYRCEIIKVDFEFQPKAGYKLQIKNVYENTRFCVIIEKYQSITKRKESRWTK